MQLIFMVSIQIIREKVFEIRGQKVMLDNDLAQLYGVDTRSLKQAVKRNITRFPEDFMFELSKVEISKVVEDGIVESKSIFGGATPYVFTEQGVAMLSSVLRSDKAIQVNIAIVRAFGMMR